MQLGNPVLEFATDFNSRAEFFWSHGLISDSTYNVFTWACNYSRYVGEYYRGFVSPMCSKVMSLVSRETSRFVDKYDVTLDVCLPSIFSQSKLLTPHVSLIIIFACFYILFSFYQGSISSIFLFLSQSFQCYSSLQQVGETIDVCVEDEMLRYLNRRDVQKALHASLVGVNSWTVCSKYYFLITFSLLNLIFVSWCVILIYAPQQNPGLRNAWPGETNNTYYWKSHKSRNSCTGIQVYLYCDINMSVISVTVIKMVPLSLQWQWGSRFSGSSDWK